MSNIQHYFALSSGIVAAGPRTHYAACTAAAVTARPPRFNFAAHVLARAAAQPRRAAYRDDTGSADLRRARATHPPVRGGARRARPAPRGARAAAGARQPRLAGGVPRRAVRRRGAGGRQHAADRRRLRVHARAFAGARGDRVARAARRRSTRRMARAAHDVDHVIVVRRARRTAAGDAHRDFAAARSHAREHRRRRPPTRAPTTSPSGSTRRARPGGRRAPCTRTPTCTGRNVTYAQNVLGADAGRTRCSRPPSCSSRTASATR